MRWMNLALLIMMTVSIISTTEGSPLAPSLELQGHRGARGLAPENSIPAFNLAYLFEMTTLELDTTLTVDGQLIVYHDTETNPTLCSEPDGRPLDSKPVVTLTAERLQSLECGLRAHDRFPEQKRQSAHPPRLAEVVNLEREWGATPFYNLEIKTDERHHTAHKKRAIEALAEELNALISDDPQGSTLRQRITVQSFDPEVLELAMTHLPSLRRSVLIEPQIDHSVSPPRVMITDTKALIRAAERVKASIISPYHEVVTESLIQEAHAEDLKVIPWTVNEPARMQALINMGVDGLISDYPNRLQRVITQMGESIECRTRHTDRDCQTPLPRDMQRTPRTPLIDLNAIDPSINVEIRYRGSNNFLGRPVKGYDAAKCLLTRLAAKALSQVQEQLRESGLSLTVFDCYRPQRAVDDFVAWAKDLQDQEKKNQYYPNVDKSALFAQGYIAKRSGHSRGSTVDLTITDLDMGTPWDFFGRESHTKHAELSVKVKAHRALLTSLMKTYGFKNYEKEWWHYTLRSELLPGLYLDLPIQ